MATKTAPKSLRHQIQDGDVAAYWAGRELTQRFPHVKSTYDRNENGVQLEHLPANDSAVFKREANAGPGYWYLTTDQEEIASLDAAAPKSHGATMFVRVKDLLDFHPPFAPLERKRAVIPFME